METITVSEAERRVWEAVEKMEEALNDLDQTVGKIDEEQRDVLASMFMKFLTQRYVIVPDRQQED